MKNQKEVEPKKISQDKISPWDIHLDTKYGVHGTFERSEFETKSQNFISGELLKKEANHNNTIVKCNF